MKENQIKQARLGKKLTQKELASQLEVSVRKISSWENNKSMPNEEMQKKLCKILGVSSIILESEKTDTSKKEVKKAKKQKKELTREERVQEEARSLPCKKINLGVPFLDDIVEDNIYYADKTIVIKDIIESAGKINVISRPKCFGKTLTLKTIQSFFSYDENPDLFKGFEISKYPEFCKKYQNQYAVVFLSLQFLQEPDFGYTRSALCRALYDTVCNFFYLEKSSKLTEEDKKQYRSLYKYRELSDKIIIESLYILTQLLYKHHEKKVIVLIEEYDVALRVSYPDGCYDQILPLMEGMISRGLNDNDALEFAVIIGCLQMSNSTDSVIAGLKDAKTYTMTSTLFSETFGFTTKDVKELLEHYHFSHKYEIIKKWYGGYRMGKKEIFCPLDVMRYIFDLRGGGMVYPQVYWGVTRITPVIRRLLKAHAEFVPEELSKLLSGETITTTLNEHVTFSTLYDSIENMWSGLFTLGYLTIDKEIKSGKEKRYKLRIPNKEIQIILLKFVRDWVGNVYTQGEKHQKLLEFYDALDQGNVEIVENFFNDFLNNTFYLSTYLKKNKINEYWYRKIFRELLTLPETRDKWYCKSDDRISEEYSNIRLKIKKKDCRHQSILFVLTYAEDENIDLHCKEVMEQIKQHKYASSIYETYDDEHIIIYSVTFHNKSCKVLKEEVKF